MPGHAACHEACAVPSPDPEVSPRWAADTSSQGRALSSEQGVRFQTEHPGSSVKPLCWPPRLLQWASHSAAAGSGPAGRVSSPQPPGQPSAGVQGPAGPRTRLLLPREFPTPRLQDVDPPPLMHGFRLDSRRACVRGAGAGDGDVTTSHSPSSVRRVPTRPARTFPFSGIFFKLW